ncbi:hypothetical protein LRY65_02065 [Candidatus Woesebacteria bacterium]|nr:hypothetical protein [Candidatus Woesebacteria bacterium]MCD8507349.1 hypothetical protein [Candidatus Woesebacteria bacterium]MCD8526978.1 hypothetical protein [Candidatus Woesebacteria bacterium]MCD8546782.1 hypothetical protein [Candidatus Woesebacteria bacterium]
MQTQSPLKAMRKEIILAIIVGVIVGLAITFGIYTVRQQIFRNQTPETIQESRLNEDNVAPTPTPTTTLSIQQPEQDFLTSEDTVQVVGRALPNSYIVILASDEEYITTADQDGDFSQEVSLALGGNKLTIHAITSSGEKEIIVRNVVYSTVDLDNQNASPSATPETTEDTEE